MSRIRISVAGTGPGSSPRSASNMNLAETFVIVRTVTFWWSFKQVPCWLTAVLQILIGFSADPDQLFTSVRIRILGAKPMRILAYPDYV
jgi:hypothetical protein